MEGSEEYWEQERVRCKESISYFYNNYVTANGEKPRPKKDEDFLVMNQGGESVIFLE
jgi:hypothetical protein